MEEIKVGDYFRTKNGYINKIRYLIEECDYSETKYSSNIIDLVEERRLYNTRIQITQI